MVQRKCCHHPLHQEGLAAACVPRLPRATCACVPSAPSVSAGTCSTAQARSFPGILESEYSHDQDTLVRIKGQNPPGPGSPEAASPHLRQAWLKLLWVLADPAALQS